MENKLQIPLQKTTKFGLQGIRKLWRIATNNNPKRLPIQYAGQEASDLIYNHLVSENPCMIARFGGLELGCVSNYLLSKNRVQQALKYISGQLKYFDWEIKDLMVNNTPGFFPAEKSYLDRFSELMLDCTPNVDVLGSWQPGELLVADKLKNAKTVPLPDLEPYRHTHPWSKALEGKNILVIHPFAGSIKNQYSQREKLFKNQDVLPEFHLDIIKAIQSISYNDVKDKYKDWFEALDVMKNEVLKKTFDMAIIGCGAYGFPLASFVKDQGKKAIHLGGATQLLFGIKGDRWNSDDFVSGLYNDYWVKPTKDETPQNSKDMENNCYW
jgi:hypothetical protein